MQLWHLWQQSPGGPWSRPASLGGPIWGEPDVVSNLDGRLEVFAPCNYHSGSNWGYEICHLWQQPGGWSGLQSLGGLIQLF